MSEEITHTLSPNLWVDNYADYLFNYAVVFKEKQQKELGWFQY